MGMMQSAGQQRSHHDGKPIPRSGPGMLGRFLDARAELVNSPKFAPSRVRQQRAAERLAAEYRTKPNRPIA